MLQRQCKQNGLCNPHTHSSAALGRPAGRATRTHRALSVRAVLEKEPQSKMLEVSDVDSVLKAQLESLLPPSLSRGAEQQSPQLPPPPPRVLTCNDSEVFCFSYGANLALATLKRRGVAPISRSPAVVLDPSIRLVFRHRGGFSTLQRLESPDDCVKYTPYMEQVHGVVYQLSKADLKALAKFEGGYQLMDMEVETYDGWRVKAQTFVSSPLAQLQVEVTPTEKYMKTLRDGAADNYLDPLYQAWLSSIDTVPSVGLGAEYFDTPAKYIAYSFLCIVALVVVSFFAQ